MDFSARALAPLEDANIVHGELDGIREVALHVVRAVVEERGRLRKP
jgi:hypothetical protein